MDAVPQTADHRRVVVRWTEFDSDPRALRENLSRLDLLLRGSGAEVRRRVRLMFGQLVAQWQAHFEGEPMAVSVQLVEGAVRISTGAARRTLSREDWPPLVTAVILDLVDDWGFDRRNEGDAWFEFRERRHH